MIITGPRHWQAHSGGINLRLTVGQAPSSTGAGPGATVTLAQLAVVRAFCTTSLVDALLRRPVTLAQAAPGGRPAQLPPKVD